jgi:DNA-binding MarR family transcriptional regulator
MPELLSQTESAPPSASAVDFFFNQVGGLAKAARDYSFSAHRLEGVPVGIAAVLQLLLQGGPRSVPNIGRARSTTRQNTQILVNRMVAEIQNPEHKRSALVQLTEEGRHLAQSVAKREVELHRLVSIEVRAHDMENATALLARLRELLSARRTALGEGPVQSPSSPEKAPPEPAMDFTPKPESQPIPEDYELPVNLL